MAKAAKAKATEKIEEPSIETELEATPDTTETTEPTDNEHSSEPINSKPARTGFLSKLKSHWPPTRKQSIITAAILAVLILIGLIPFTRNAVFGLVLKTSVTVEAYDELITEDQKARVQMTDLTVKIDGVERATKATSPVTIRKVKPGKHTVEISKTNYKTEKRELTANLQLGKQRNSLTTKLVATGIPAKISVTNFISGDTVKGATITVDKSTATSDDKGNALLILPIQASKEYKASISGDGFVTQDVKLAYVDGRTTIAVQAVPAGKVYFLSKQSGKVDVVKTNLDGSERTVVFAATGKENERTTTMISTTDWKYLALSTHREDKKSQLILIDTSNDSATTMDDGNANFTLLGWDNKKLVYQSENLDIPEFKTGRNKLKAYDADAKKISIYHQTSADGDSTNDYTSEFISGAQIVNHRLFYVISHTGTRYSGEGSSIYSSVIATGEKKKLYTYTVGFAYLTYASATEAFYTHNAYENGQNKTTYYRVDANGGWMTAEKPYDEIDQYTYFISPDNKKLLWSEPRDGKQTVLLGDEYAKNSKVLYTLSELKPYAWFSDDYALYSKRDSELYIASIKKDSTPKKIADYHRPVDISFRGYGGGGGGPY